MAALLYGIPARDTISLVGSAAIVVLLSASATAIPLLRAARVDPANALRQDN
jgi:ABC-type lipoprotein release transport system permease subunit